MKQRIAFIVLLAAFSLSAQATADTLLLASLENNARRTYIYNTDSSLAYAQLILEKCRTNDAPVFHAFALNWSGICYMRMNVPDSAEAYYQRTIAYAETNGVPSLAQKARLNRSINYFQLGQYETAAAYALEALEAFRQQGDSLGMAHAQYNLGNCFSRLERHDEALQLYQEAAPAYRSLGRPIEQANLYNAMGSAYELLQQPKAAIRMFRKAAGIKTAIASEMYCASEFNNIGTNYLYSKSDSASFYYHKAKSAAKQLGDDRNATIALLNLATYHNTNQHTDSAMHYAKLGWLAADSVHDDNLRSTGYLQLSMAHRLAGKSNEAFDYYAAHIALKDSLESADVVERVSRLQEEYKVADKERKLLAKDLILKEKDATLQRQLVWIIGIATGSVVLLIVIFFLFYRYRSNKRIELQESQLAMEKERRRIAMDLHDHLGAELTYVSSKLDTQIYRSGNQQEKAALNSLSDQLRKANATLRETVWSVRSESISSEDLAQRIRSFGRRILDESNAEFSVDTTAEVILTSQQALELYRIAQEAITNAFKYAAAAKITVKITVNDTAIHLEIKDNGQGFNMEETTGGYGLRNMQQRAENIHGTLEINSKPGHGTAIAVKAPVS